MDMISYFAAPEKTPLSWETRIQIAIDVANALVIAVDSVVFHICRFVYTKLSSF